MTLSHSYDDKDNCVQCGCNRYMVAQVNCPKGFREDATAEREQLNGEVRAWRERCGRLGLELKKSERALDNTLETNRQLRKVLIVERDISLSVWLRRRLRRWRTK